MVSKILKLLNQEVGAVNQAALLLGVFTFLSQFLALIRDRLFTSKLGAGSELDVYYASFQMPDIIFNLVATLVSVTVLLPILLSITEKEGTEKAHNFFSQVFTAFSVVVLIVSCVAFVFAPYIARFVVPGFSPEQIAELVNLSRIMLLSPILLGISNLFGSITQMTKRFVVFAISPLLYNLGIIIGILFFYERFGLSGLAYGVVLGSFLHALIQVPALIKDRMLPRFTMVQDWVMLRTLALVSFPRTFGLVVHSVTLLVLISFATTMGEGSVSIFRLSMNLQNIPLALIGASFSVAAFPAITKHFTNGNTDQFLETIGNAARQIIFWSIPVTVLFIVLRAQIVRVILGSQVFTWDQTRLAAAALAIFVISVTAQSLILLFTRAFYATGDTKRPVFVNFISSSVIVLCSFYVSYVYKDGTLIQDVLVTILRVDGVSGIRVISLAFAYSIGSIINAIILMKIFQKRHIKRKRFYLQKTLIDSLIGALVMGLVSYGTLHVLDNILDLNTFSGILLQGLTAGILGLTAGMVVYQLIKNQEFMNLKNALYRKFKGIETVSVSQEDIG